VLSKIVVYPNPDCALCHGTGTVYDSVPWGNGSTSMPSTCECWAGGATDEQIERIEDGESFEVAMSV